MSRFAFCSALAFVLITASAFAETFYVSPDGRAGWSGRLAAPNAAGTDGPLPSLEAARDAVRAAKTRGTGPITVLLRQGTYRLTQPFVLTPADSGTPERPIVYANYPGETVEISGGRLITRWTKSKGSAWTAAVPEAATGKWVFHQLFVDGARAVRARTPNFGFLRADGPSSQDKPYRLHYRGNDVLPQWAGTDAEVVAYLAWAEIRMPIVNVDTETHVALLGTDPRKSNREVDARYYIENAPGTLDNGGEWYLDRKAGTVSYIPVSTEDMSHVSVVTPVLRQLVRLEGKPEAGEFVRNITFRGLRFCHTDWEIDPRGMADPQAAIVRSTGESSAPATAVFDAVGALDCAVERCQFAHHGDYAIWFGRGSKRNQIVGNEIFDMGAGGVLIGETAMRPDENERNRGNSITDNHIHNLGLVFPAAVGIWVGQSSGNEISHNHVHDLFYTAISVGWTWGYAENQCRDNHIDFNHLHDIGKGVLSDMGAIYTLGVQPGSTIRNNLIHDVEGFTYGGWGIYPDEGSSDIVIENNIVYGCKSAGFHQHYGKENIVRNNIFAFNRDYQLMRTRVEDHVPFFFKRNIVYFDQGRLLGTRWSDNQLRMDNNVYYDLRGADIRFSGKTFAEWKAAGKDAHSLVADPQFVDAGSYNFRLRPDSPVLKLGFRQIDMSTVGPRPQAVSKP